MWNLKKPRLTKEINKTKLIDTENILVVARARTGGKGEAKWAKVVRKYKIPSYKVRQTWGYNIQHNYG